MRESEPQPGDQASLPWDELTRSRRGKWLAIAQRVLGDSHQAEDVVQETLARILAAADADRPRNLDAYITTAVRMNALKHRARRRSWAKLEHEPAISDDDDNPLEIDPLTLELAVHDLPTMQQAVIRMRYYTGMSFRQIAETLSISINTAASSTRYALNNLRRSLADETSDKE